MLLVGMSPLYPRLPPLYRQEVSSQRVCIYIYMRGQSREGSLEGGEKWTRNESERELSKGCF